MEHKEAIRKLKHQIKSLSVEQREAKTLMHMDHRKWESDPKYQAFKKKHQNEYGNFWLQPDVLDRKVAITAALNYYNELRGKGCHHDISDYAQLRYGSALKKLHDEFAIEEQVVV